MTSSDIINKNYDSFYKSEEHSKMRAALISIAQELERFHTSQETFTTEADTNEEIVKKIIMLKSKLRLKRKQVKKLRKDLLTACMVAKTVMSAKENESFKLTNHIHFTKSECDTLIQKNKFNSLYIEEVKQENLQLKEKIKAIGAFVTLGYKELQKMRKMPVQEISTMHQLKEIMVCCGEYYADYYNERQKTRLLEQRNRFLNHKINIVTSNLEAVNEKLHPSRHQNLKPTKEKAAVGHQAKTESCTHMSNCTHSTYYVNHNRILGKKKTTRVQTLSLDFSSHLSLVKTLLENQDDMLKDLKKISQELVIQSDI